MKKKKIAIIGTNGIPAKYGGFETLAEYLVKYLSNDYEITVYCSKTKKKNRLKNFSGAKLIYLPLKANGWQSMIYDSLSIIRALFSKDILIILGFSGALAFPFKSLAKSRVIFNLGGIEWKKVRGGKTFSDIEIAAKKWFERICIKFSDIIIVDNNVIQDYLTNRYNVKSTIAEYGGDHSIKVSASEELKEKYPFLKAQYDVTVSRAQEDMNIHMVIEAYKKIPERNVVIISNWEISEYGRALKKNTKGVYANIFIQDSIYDISVLNAIRSNAEIYLHTHSLCGTAPSLVEAMSLGLPVVCFDVETSRSATDGEAAYFSDENSLKDILQKMDSLTKKKNRDKMLSIASQRYTWHRIAEIYKECIEKV